jgi:hypothetical protein
MKAGLAIFVVIMITGILLTCIDPYSPDLKEFENLLVVEALLTDEDSPGYVSLSRTFKSLDEDPVKVTGALVRITDNEGKNNILTETEEGLYRTDNLLFRGEAGKEYTLYIQTPEGAEYESDPCLLYPAPEIDSLYYTGDSELSDDGLAATEGIRLFIDSSGEGGSGYYRWTFDEWWKIEIPDPVKFIYISDTEVVEKKIENQICWANRSSHDIMIHAGLTENNISLEKKSLLFIPTALTNRFSVRYYFRLKQYSLSQKEYEFWDLMSKLNETGGDIFEKQPFTVSGNIHGINDPGEQVLGFFEVSGVKEKDIYITPSEIYALGLPLYRYECEKIILGPDDFPPPLSPGAQVTFDKIYKWYQGSDYLFIEPINDKEGNLMKLVFTSAVCADCTLTGTPERPDFWKE